MFSMYVPWHICACIHTQTCIHTNIYTYYMHTYTIFNEKKTLHLWSGGLPSQPSVSLKSFVHPLPMTFHLSNLRWTELTISCVWSYPPALSGLLRQTLSPIWLLPPLLLYSLTTVLSFQSACQMMVPGLHKSLGFCPLSPLKLFCFVFHLAHGSEALG